VWSKEVESSALIVNKAPTVDSLAIEIRSVEVINFCLVMVNPHECVIVGTHD
jgi:hypothetical protein